MPTTVTESRTGRRKSVGSMERQYVIAGATSEAEALVALLAYVPATLEGLTLDRSNCDVEEIAFNGTEAFFIGHAKWISEDQTAGSFSISFDISGQTRHVTQSLYQVDKLWLAGEPQRDFKGAINVSEDGTIGGVDIIIPTFTFVLDYTVDPANINDTYIGTLRDLVGTINASPFKGFLAGELLFTKVSGRKRDEEAWDLSYGFSVEKNVSLRNVGGITVPYKRGWDYLWVYYKTMEDPPTVIAKRPAAVFIEQLYTDTNYGLLGLP